MPISTTERTDTYKWGTGTSCSRWMGRKKNETTSCKTLNETDSILLKEQYVRSHTIWSGPQTHSGSRSPTRFFTKQNNHQTDCVRTQSHTHTHTAPSNRSIVLFFILDWKAFTNLSLSRFLSIFIAISAFMSISMLCTHNSLPPPPLLQLLALASCFQLCYYFSFWLTFSISFL